MNLQLQLELGIPLLLSAILSAVVGIERERVDHPAGLRTHMLVGTGSCLFTMLSIYGFPEGDPGRVASQIVSGLGFLGAGAIIRQRNDVQGLTTAANLWATAALGMAAGSGMWLLAIIATLTLWTVLVLVRHFEVRVIATKEKRLD